MKRNILIGLLVSLVVVIFIWGLSQEVDANSYADGAVTIDETFTSGSLGEAVTVYSEVYEVTSLTITEGVVNADDFSWIIDNLSDLETLEISGNATVHSTSDSSVDTPDNSVPEYAFSGMGSLKEVTITSAITIGESAFESCEVLQSLDFPEVIIIGDNAFNECYELTSVSLPMVTTIGKYAFAYCNAFESIDLPEAITIGDYAFSENSTLTSVNLPEVISIGEGAFYQCTSLTSVEVVKATTIGDEAFSECEELADVNMPLVTTIGYEAFYSCRGLIDVDLPEVVTIGNRAFYDCNNIETINIPKVTNIGEYAFSFVTQLLNVDLPEVETIGRGAFESCESLISISAPEVSIIEEQTFRNCINLASVDIPEVITISEESFKGCQSIESLNLPKVETIEPFAFNSCTSLTNVNMPVVTSIDSYALVNCNALNSITLGETVPAVSSSNAFNNISTDSPTIYVPYGSAISYKEDTSDGDGTDDEWYGWTIHEMSNDDTLSGLTISSGTLNPTFDSSITAYSTDVTNDITSIEVTPEVNDSNATITVEGEEVASGSDSTVSLDVGTNEINIIVTSEDGSANTETIITVTREASDDATLSGLSISAGTLDPTFDSSITDYAAEVTNDVDSIGVTPEANDSNATVTVEGEEVTSGEAAEVALSVGTNEINIVVTAEDGSTTSEAVITVTRAVSDDATLSGLSISAGTLDPTFDSSINDYTADVTNDIASIEVTPEANDSNATVTVEGEEVTSGEAAEVALSVGTNEINIVVTAEDGSTTSETVITVTRAVSDDATLSGLSISAGTLDPTFDSSITDYAAEVTNDVDSIEITPEANDSNATVTVEGEEVASGEAAEVALSVGINEINIVVTAEDGSTTSETVITVTRAFSDDVKLSDLDISSGTLNPTFDSDTTIYKVDVTNDITSIEVTPTANDSNATITVEGEEVTSGETAEVPLSIGENEINIVVTAEDGSTTAETVMTVRRVVSDDATLSDLSISKGTLDPAFDNSTTEYTVDVTNNVSSIEVTPEANDRNATVTVKGDQVISGESVEVPLSVGANEISIIVTAQDGVTTIETIITVTRANSSSNSSDKSSNNSTKETTDTIIEQLESEDLEEVIVEVTVEDNETISEDVFETLKEKGGKLVIDGDWYQWEFDGQSEAEEVNADFEPSIEVIDKDEVDIELDNDKGFIIKTKYEGKLPIKAKLKIKVNKFAKNQTVYLYYYNEATGKLELSGTAVNEDGQAEFEITHCSIYTVTEKPAFKEGYEKIAYASGYDDGTFRPNKSLSRAEAAVMLSRLLESEGIQGQSEFSDIDMWAEEEIVILSELDVINGYSDDTFKPNNDITRGELAVIMSKLLGLDINEDIAGFKDTKDHWAENAIIALRDEGIVNGYSDGRFKPDDVVTRVEAIAMINRAFEREADETKVYDNPFGDIDNNHWAFYLIMNAAGQ